MTNHASMTRGSSLVQACDSSHPFTLDVYVSPVVNQFFLIAEYWNLLLQSGQLVLMALAFDYVVCQLRNPVYMTIVSLRL